MALADYSLTVFVGDVEYKKFRNRFVGISGQDIPDTPISDKGNHVGGLACLQNVWVAELKASTIAHEALHALDIMYSHIGISSHPDKVDELKAYQLQYILERMGL